MPKSITAGPTLSGKLTITIPDLEIMPGPVRKVLAKSGGAWWVRNCNGAKGINAHPRCSNADVRRDVIRLTIDGYRYIGPTPEWIRKRVVDVADAGHSVRGGTGELDLSKFVPIRTVRNDVTVSGVVKIRPDGTTGSGRKQRSDAGGTHNFARR